VVSIHGGVDRVAQKEQLAIQDNGHTNNNKVVVATPGRLLDLLEEEEKVQQKQPTNTNNANHKKLSPPVVYYHWIVLDEADQLAKDGDLGVQVNKILKLVQTKQSRLALVSATYPERVQEQFQEWMGTNHVLVQVDHISHPPRSTTTANAKNSDNNNNNNNNTPDTQAQRNAPLGIVFFSRIEKLKQVAKMLEREGKKFPFVELHSQLSPPTLRQTNLHKFTVGQTPLLLATDVAARGIDIPSIKFVIQYDFPGNLQQYVHRCGRAGRSGDEATVYSFFTRNLKLMAPDLIQLLEANKAWVDPNLRELLVVGNNNKSQKKNKKQQQQQQQNKKPPAKPNPTNKTDDEALSDVDDFPELAPNRIVLKRASHVCDTSSSDEDESMQ
jgi:ATP-dependent RNA helicase DDX5/DBP2